MLFARIADFVVKRHKAIIVFWIMVLIGAVLANQVWKVGDVVSYSISGFIPKDTESSKAGDIINEQFPTGTSISSIVVVVVAPNAASADVKYFIINLDGMVAASRGISDANPSISYTLTNGQTVELTHRISYLNDPAQSNVYRIYAGAVFSLAQNLSGPLHDNVTYAQGLLLMYYGLPATYVNAWVLSGGTLASNATAYSSAFDFINSTFFPTQLRPLASGYLPVFDGLWKASFFDPSYSGKTPTDRGEGAIKQALPAFLNTLPPQVMPPEAKAMQLNFPTTFDMTNFQSLALIENYTFTAFASFAPASRAFFSDLYHNLTASPNVIELASFSKSYVVRYSLTELKQRVFLPYDVTSFFFSPDYKISLMNYGFTKESGFTESDGSTPILDDVKAFRSMIQQLKDKSSVTFEVYTSGSAASDLDESIIFGGAAEFMVTAALVVILIGLYFRSVVSPAFPLGMVGIAIIISNLFIFLMGTYFFAIAFVTPAVLQTILLGAGTDYSIFLISRYRDERLKGKTRDEAVRTSVTWAGESIATSGSAVILSFAALGLASFPVVKTMGITIGFGIAVALILSITLVPAILMVVGNGVFWPYSRRMKEPKKVKSVTRKYFRASAKFSMRHAKAIVLIAILVSIPATYFVVTEKAGYDFSKGVPPTESSRGLDAMSSAFGAGYFFQSYIVVQFPDDMILSNSSLSIPKMYALDNLTMAVKSGNAGIKTIQGPTNPEGTTLPYRNWALLTSEQKQQLVSAVRPFVGKDNRTVKIDITLSAAVFSSDAVGAVDRIGTDLKKTKESEPALQGAATYVGGATAIINDVAESTNNDLRVMAIVVAIGLFVILMIVLGSVLIPLRAIITILLSITWTLAATIVIFRFWRGLDMVFVLPLIIFVLAMGLGMDYDIFIITRIREEVIKGRSDKKAITISISRTGGIISACGIVMAGAFLTLMLSPLPFLQQMGFALAFVVLIDSMVVRIYVVPAIMVLAGRYNWWAPKFLQRIRTPANVKRDQVRKEQKGNK